MVSFNQCAHVTIRASVKEILLFINSYWSWAKLVMCHCNGGLRESQSVTTEYSELVSAKPYTGLVLCFYWNHFLNESPTSIAILLLSLVLASLLVLLAIPPNSNFELPVYKPSIASFLSFLIKFYGWSSPQAVHPLVHLLARSLSRIQNKITWVFASLWQLGLQLASRV